MSDAIELRSRIIQGPAAGPHVLIVGGVHGDEFEPMAAIRQLMNTLDGKLICGKVTLVPVVNEAAYRRKYRAAEDDKDLARTCPGSPTGSITERIAHALSELIRTADYFVDLHTGGTTYDILPLAGYACVPDADLLDTQRMMARAMNLPIVWGSDYRLEGRSLSVARDANVPAIYAEYGGAARMLPQGVSDYHDGCLNLLGQLNMIDHAQPASRVEHVIEDARPNAGHLQIQNPAPFEGFFQSKVQLGDHVTPGDTLGTVTDILGDRVENIVSQQTGIVIVLKNFCKVDENEGCMVILETSANTNANGEGT